MCEFICDFVTDFIKTEFTDVLHKSNYEDLCDGNLLSHLSLFKFNVCVNARVMSCLSLFIPF